MVDLRAMASSPELMGCTSWSACRKLFQGTMVLGWERSGETVVTPGTRQTLEKTESHHTQRSTASVQQKLGCAVDWEWDVFLSVPVSKLITKKSFPTVLRQYDTN